MPVSSKKVAIGLSGGVDSATSAYLLKQQGYEVTGVYLVCWQQPGCRTDNDRKDAIKVALHLGIEIKILDFIDEYKKKVMDHFYSEYRNGRTPNPDILCNSEIKFGLFYDWVMANGFDYMATGHYAKIIKQGLRIKDKELSIKNINSKPSYQLLATNYQLSIPKDVHKDQTYFLYKLKQEQLSHILFPLSDYLKSEVREMAKKANLPVADKKDSMGICFVGDINVPLLLKEKFGEKKGEVILADGTVVGEHDGYYLFTVGSRGGWRRKPSIKNTNFKNDELPPLYITKIDPKTNTVTVSKRQECERDEFEIENLHLINSDFDPCHLLITTYHYLVRIRNTGELIPAQISQITDDKYKVKLSKSEFGVSAGQSCVIYQLPTNNNQLTTNNCQRTTTNEQLPTNNLQPTTIMVLGGGVIV